MTDIPTEPEQYADPASSSLPSEEEIARVIRETLPLTPHMEVAEHTASAILALIRPAFEAKEREIAATHDAYQQAAVDAVALCHEAEARALAAEAKLAQAVEALEPFARAAGDDTAVPDFLRAPDSHAVLFDGLGDNCRPSVTVGDLRRARAASSAIQGETTG